MRIRITIIALLLLPLTVWAQATKSYNTFTVYNEAINPACLALFNGNTDEKELIRSVNLFSCQHSTLTRQKTLKNKKGQLFFYRNNKNLKKGAYYYKLIGRAQNGIFVVNTYNADGRKGILLDQVLFFRIKPDATYEYKAGGTAHKDDNPSLVLLGYLSGGNYCSGGLKSITLKGNTLYVTAYIDHQPAHECKLHRSFTIDLNDMK